MTTKGMVSSRTCCIGAVKCTASPDIYVGQQNLLPIPHSYHILCHHPLITSLSIVNSSRSHHLLSNYWVRKMSCKVSSSDCIHSPERATRDPSLIFGPLKEPHVAWPTQFINGITESSQWFLRSLSYLLSLSQMRLYQIASSKIFFCPAVVTGPPLSFSKGQ